MRLAKSKKPHKVRGRAAKLRRQRVALDGLQSRVKTEEKVQKQGGYVRGSALERMKYEIDRLSTACSVRS